ncbi:ubiquinone/menaquinone [Coniochaeta sp. PMI_546]|nr:ubiquinone/menaquinone [Coniochaeta sp. PMI_546]
MDDRGTLVFIIFCVIIVIAFALFYAIKCSRRFASEADQRQREADAPVATAAQLNTPKMAARPPMLRRALQSCTRCSLASQSVLATRPFSSSTPTSSSPPPPAASQHDGPSSSTTHFGFETVPEAEKQHRVAEVFTSVAESYDRMNDLMSFGWHRVWKDHFVRTLNPGFSPLSNPPSAPQHILDIAGGTGDIAFRLLNHAQTINGNPSVHVTVSDINPSMLAVGKQRSLSLPANQQSNLSWLEANAEDLSTCRPLRSSSSPSSSSNPTTVSIPDNSIDLYTVAFGIRNFTSIPAALREAHRVLKPGGVFACLEFSKADAHPLFNAVYKRWSFGAIPLIGQLVAGDRDSYQYLVESIERFPSQEEFRDLILDAGFVVGGEGYENLTGGVAAIHRGMKPRK